MSSHKNLRFPAIIIVLGVIFSVAAVIATVSAFHLLQEGISETGAYDVSGAAASGAYADAVTLDAQFTEDAPFTDVPVNHRNYVAIENLRQLKLVAGYGDGTFRPAQLVTRAEATAMIVRALDPDNPDPDPGRFKNCFEDVAREWFAKYVCFGKSNLWLKGYPGTQLFRPGAQVIIVEFLRMSIDAFKIGQQSPILLYKHMWDIPLGYKNEPEKFPGIQWWETYMVTARFWGFLDATLPAPKLVSRGETAEIIYRIMRQKNLIP